MDLICNPSYSNLLALNIHDTVKFLNLSEDNGNTGALTKNDFSLTDAALPSLPQRVDSYNVNCMAWCAYGDSTASNTLAIGLANGKVILLWPGSGRDVAHWNSGLLYQPTNSKHCTALAWNKAQPELLAMGMDRSRTDHSLVVWDLSSTNAFVEPSGSLTEIPRINAKPHAEGCFAETVNSAMWSGNDSKAIITGVGAKYLRVYDLRNFRSLINAVNTKATFGLCQDPCLDSRFASFFENQVHIWDLRNFSKPACHISAKFNILKAEWCPTRSGWLATISSGSSDGRHIKVYDTAHTTVADGEPAIAYHHVEQIVKLNLDNDESVGSFAWRQDSNNRLVAVTTNGTLHCVDSPERISVGWTRDMTIVPACKQIYQCFNMRMTDEKQSSTPDSIEEILYKRATNGYGLGDTLDHSDSKINLQPDNKALSIFWKWIKMAKESFPIALSPESKPPQSLVPKGMRGNRSANANSVLSSRFCGLHSELKQNNSVGEPVSWNGIPNVQCTIYKSRQRDRALKLCGWTSIEELRNDNSLFRSDLLKSSNVERSSTIALWHLDMQLAIDILRSGSGSGDNGSNFSVVAMALSGYPANGTSPLWHEMCSNLRKSMPSPYLRAAFAFLNFQHDGKNNYKELLRSTEISIADRVGFACTYLPDEILVEVLDDIAESALKDGDLEGVMVTGLTTERGIKLMQNYVDATKDVQTAALSLIQTNSVDVLRNRTSSHLIDCYKDLLNIWQLWMERASVDVTIGKIPAAQQVRRQPIGMSVQCNFCGRSVRHNAKPQHFRGRSMLALQGSGAMNKPTSCPNCRKPLPRCSVCCMHLGTSQIGNLDNTESMQEIGGSVIGNWFAWCPFCQHGGHTKHLMDWFEEHSDCPVAGCVCKCQSPKS